MDPKDLVNIFDAATKVTSPFALGAFGIAAVVAIVWMLLAFRARQAAYRKNQQLEEILPAPAAAYSTHTQYQYRPPQRSLPSRPRPPMIPKLAWIVLIVAIAVPAAAWAFVATHSDLPYIARVLAVDKNLGLVRDPEVVCSVGGGKSTFDGGVQFEIPPSNLPADKSVGFYATTKTSHGEKAVVFGKPRSVSVTIDMIPLPPPAQPPPSQRSTGSVPAKIDSSWLGTYKSDKQVSPSILSTYTATLNEDKITITDYRTENSKPICDAVWTGVLRQEQPGVLAFRASRKGQAGHFFSYYAPEVLVGTVSRTGSHAIKVNVPADPRWQNISLE